MREAFRVGLASPAFSRSVALASILLIALLAFPVPLFAGSIEVQATGVAEAEVAALVFRFRLTVDDESAVAAARAFLAARARIDKAFAELGFEALTLRGGGVEIAAMSEPNDFGGMVIVNGRPENAPSREFIRCSESISVRLPMVAAEAPEKLLERIGQVLDVAEDVGLGAAEPMVVLPNAWMQQGVAAQQRRSIFDVEVADPEAARHAAELLAIESARQRAARLASAAGLELGEPLSVRVTRTAPLALSGDDLAKARQEVDLTVTFTTR